MSGIRAGLGLACALALAGCGSSGGDAAGGANREAEAPTTPSGPPVTPDRVNGATITGRVAFTGTAPARKIIDMSANPPCQRANAGAPAKTEEVVVNPNGTLKNAFVWVKSGLPRENWAVPGAPASLDQRGCVYAPHVLGVMAGQTVEVLNSDPTNHDVHAQAEMNQDWNRSQPVGSGALTMSFPRQEIMVPFKCNVHPWMRAYVGVVSHPFYAVTGDDGTFTITGLPPGTYTIESWHEAYGVHDQQVTVAPRESKTVDFTYKG
ncbi:MAG: carboxypeptidase regulatory-like domain-containing protein [Acidobacteriia bacterium]|nr:carboxypeptidase regulatory-like domain-containing protein [Terriglobia bacterium]